MEQSSKEERRHNADSSERNSKLPRCTRHLELSVTLTAIKPLIPAVERNDDINHLETHVRVKPRLVENEGVKPDVHNRRGPTPDILPDAEIYADDSEQRRDSLEWIHRGENTLYVSPMQFRVIRAALLFMVASACFQFRRPPPQPVN